MTTVSEITIRRPDDWHVHLRDGAMLRAVAGYTARHFGRAIVMPNLVPPVTTVAAAEAYRARIAAAAGDTRFTPLMTCYLTDDADADEIARGFAAGVFAAVKLYPANATTNSASGVTGIAKVRRVIARLEEIGMPLCVHGEVTEPDVDVFDREAIFVERVAMPLLHDYPALKLVFEHVTTVEAVDFVRASGPNVAATVTPHHMLINRNALFRGGLRPHMYCLPVAKRETHREAVVEAAVSGDPSFFLGTDSAPHPVHLKEADCGCAGIFNAPSALATYAGIFEAEGGLDRLEAFASLNGPRFYGMAPNDATLRLVRAPAPVAERLGGGDAETTLVPFRAGETLAWRVDAG